MATIGRRRGVKHPMCGLIAILLWCMAAIPSSADDPIVIQFVGVSPPVSGCACQAVEVTVKARDYDSTTSGVGCDDLVFHALPYGSGWTPAAAPWRDGDGWWHQTFRKTFSDPGEYPLGGGEYIFRALDLDIFHGENDLDDQVVRTKVIIQDHYAKYTPISCTIDAPANGNGYPPGTEVTCIATASDLDTKNCTPGEPDAVTYSWTTTGGSFTGSGSSVTWHAPETAGTYKISVTADDADDVPGYCGNKSDEAVTKWVDVTVGIIHVSKNGDNTDGLTWGKAKTTVQGGLNAASAGGEVWVKADTYQESATILLTAGVGLYGGFDATESYREDRNWRSHTTILRGQGTAENPASVVTSPADAGLDTVIDGFTITNGVAYQGGGIRCVNSSPTIANNVITDNETASGDNPIGGGIYCENSSAMIIGNTITSNSAYQAGGAIYCASCTDIHVLNNLMYDNSASNWCGAVYFDSSSGLIASNTIAGNTAPLYPYAVVAYGSSITVSNNIIAFNSSGLDCSTAATVKCNDLHNPGGTDCSIDLDPEDGNIFLDPLFVPSDDYHLAANSPCIDAGSNDDAQLAVPDIDGEYRVRNGTIDIGADESETGCIWYTVSLSADPRSAPEGTPIIVTGNLVTSPNTPVRNCQVEVTVDGGVLVSLVNGYLASETTGYVNTDDSGRFTAVVKRDDPGYVTVTAQAANPCGTENATGTIDLAFYDPDAPVEIFFCIDVTGSMGVEGSHRALESVHYLLNDLAAEGMVFRVGGIKFNEGESDCDDKIYLEEGDQFQSLHAFTTVNDFINNWVDTDYSPRGGDTPELQLDALYYAVQDMNAYCTPWNSNRYIVLITDSPYHEDGCGSEVAKQQVVDELTDSGCQTFISLWESTPESHTLETYWYNNMTVNGGEFDPPEYFAEDPEGLYPLDALRDDILGAP